MKRFSLEIPIYLIKIWPPYQITIQPMNHNKHNLRVHHMVFGMDNV